MGTVRVNLQSGQYDVRVAAGIIGSAGAGGVGEALRGVSSAGRVGIVTDANVGPKYLDLLRAGLASAGFEAVAVVVPAGESNKSIRSLELIYDAFLAARLERSTPILALGGGIVGDVAGFAAATILRGVPFVQIPTTLLSMVDASVGGKTGVNHGAGKNLIGAFHQPVLVLADVSVLGTLPRLELISGLAECVKHMVIRDERGFAELESSIDSILALELASLLKLVADNVAVKARVVMADPFERGERAHLNFGHTFGHGIETACDYTLTHGQCVALGMVAASRLAVRLGLLEQTSCDRIVRLLSRIGLPISGLSCSTDAVIHAMRSDKKIERDRFRFILPDRIGSVLIRDDIAEPMIREMIDSLR